MKPKRTLVTWWSVSYFWIVFSLTIAALSTYSFIQVEWIVQREVIKNTSLFSKHSSLSFIFENMNISQRQDLMRNTKIDTVWRKETFQESNSSTISIPENRDKLFPEYNKTIIIAKFGVIGVCSRHNLETEICELYQKAHHNLSPLWPILMLFGSTACLSFCILSVISILAVSLPTPLLRFQVAKTIGQAQAIAVVLLFLTLLGFPCGFGSEFVRLYCGPSSGVYAIGNCEVGWAYALLFVCASLAMYCPILVQFTFYFKQDNKYHCHFDP